MQETSRDAGLPVRMLRILGEGGIRSIAELARRLEVSEALVGMIAEDLARRGYLAVLGDGCGACSGCGSAAGSSRSRGSCGVPGTSTSTPPVLSLTAKGREAARA